MASKPVVDGFERQLGGRIRIVRFDVATVNGRKLASQVKLDLTPTFIGFDAQGAERWRSQGSANRAELWAKIVTL